MAAPGRTTIMCGTPSSLVGAAGESNFRHTPTRLPGVGSVSIGGCGFALGVGGVEPLGQPAGVGAHPPAANAAVPPVARHYRPLRAVGAHYQRLQDSAPGSTRASSRSASAPSPTWCAGRRRPADDRAGRQGDGLVLSAPSIASGRGAGARSSGRSSTAADGVAPAPQVPPAAGQERRPLPRGHASPPSAMIAMPALWARDSASSFSATRPAANDLPAVNAEVWWTARGGI